MVGKFGEWVVHVVVALAVEEAMVAIPAVLVVWHSYIPVTQGPQSSSPASSARPSPFSPASQSTLSFPDDIGPPPPFPRGPPPPPPPADCCSF